MARPRGTDVPSANPPEVPLYLRRSTNPYLERQGYLSNSRPSTANGGEGSRPPTSTARDQPRPSSSSAATRPPPRHQLMQVSCKQPNFVVSDREVLRYFSFFQEPVFDSAADTTADGAGFRVRRFVICYYIASSSLSVDEPKQANSGLAQGMFMKKQQVPRPKTRAGRKAGPSAGEAGSLLQPSDFSVGGTIELYGRVFKIVDADEFTRDYHQRALGTTLAPAQEYPDDGYETRRSFLTRPPRQQQPPKPVPFTQRDSSVLRFFCAYEDERKAGGRRQYTLYYYLVDGTVEIKEVAEPGHVHFPNLLKRQKLPKGGSLFVPTASVESDRGLDANRESVPYLGWEDLRCGEAVTVYGRHLLLLSCDKATIDWYAGRGVSQVPLHLSMRDTAPPVKIRVAPPNGFGTDDDLYALGLKLEPSLYEDKTTRQERSVREAKVLRFMVHLLRADGSEVDSRELILNFFLFDESISIYEPPVRNSGVGGGLFLARGKYKKFIEKRKGEEAAAAANTTTTTLGGSLSRFLRPSDFLLTSPPVTLEDASTGTRLFTLKAVGYDDYTRKILEGGAQGEEAQSSSSSSLVVVTLQKLAEALVAASVPVRAAFRQADKAGSGVLSVATFVSVVRQLEAQARCRPSASDKELERACEWFLDSSEGMGGGLVRYDEAVDALAMCAPKTVFDQAKEAVGAATLTLEERIFKVLSKLLMGGEGQGWNLRRTLRRMDSDRTGTLGMETWVSALKEHGLASLMSRSEAASLLLQYDASGSARLSYQVLCDAVFVGDFSPLPQPPSAAGNAPPPAPTQAASSNNNKGVRRGQGSVKQYLSQLTESVITCDGDVRKQLHNAIQSFSSSFSRTARKRILRKIWMAFDGGRTGRITRAQFTAGLEETAAEFRLDFLDRDKQVLGEFIFPDPVKSRVDYERLLEAFCSRDVRACEALREESRAALTTDDALAFRAEDDQRTRDFGGTLKVVGLVH